jgi:hypothetical protein
MCVPGNATVVSGSEIALIEPAYVEWDNETAYYPIIMQSADSWDVAVNIAPPAGYVADTTLLTQALINTTSSDDVSAIQFTLTEVGSIPGDAVTNFNLLDKKDNKRTQFKSAIKSKLSKRLAKLKGTDEFGNVIAPPKKISIFCKIFRLGC